MKSTRSICIRYYVDDTEVPWDREYFKGKRGHDTRKDPRKGLFQNHHGKFDLHVFGDNIVSVEKTKLHPRQRRYPMDSGYDEDYVIVPTMESILSGDVPLPFRVNHSSSNPTHKLVWHSHSRDYPHSHPVLEGVCEIDIGTEVTFNYKL